MKRTKKIAIVIMLVIAIATLVTALTACKIKDYDMSGVSFADATYTYDGQEHKIEIVGTLPKGVTVTYTNNTLTDVGEVTATAVFTGDDSYNPIPPMTAKLKITPATVQGVVLADKTVTYNGQEHVLELTGELPQGSSVVYTNNKAIDAGVYNVTAVITNPNYETKTLTATLTVQKATYDMSGVVFADKTVAYDGQPHTLEVTGNLPQGVTVAYSQNTLIEVGELTVTATFTGDSQNYNPIPNKTATLKIVSDGSYHKVAFVLSDTETITRVVKHGEGVLNIPDVPERVGYIGTWDADLASITTDLTIQPTYTLINYTITYNVNGGTNSPDNPATYTVEQSVKLSSPSIDKTGCTFSGWFTTPTFATGTRISSIAVGTTGDLTLYAKWAEYGIESAEGFTFDYDNYELPAITMTVSNSKTTLPLSAAIKVSDGCSWKISNDIDGTVIIFTKNITLQDGHNVKYITVWNNENPDLNAVYILDVYRLSMFDATFLSDGETYAVSTAEENSTVTEPTAPQKTGYTFMGWLANNSATVAQFPYKLTEATTFVASYKANQYTITYDANNGTLLGNETQTVTYDSPFVLHTVQRTGYTFMGYTYNGYPLTSGIWQIADDIAVIANWQAINYRINYNLNGGTNASANPSSYTILTNTVTFAEPTKTGYTFNAWYTTEDFQNGTQISKIEQNSVGEVNLYAKFTANTYTITYVANGGTLEQTTQIVTFDADVTLYGITRTGYTFTGYTYNGKAFASGMYRIADNITIEATWQVNTYTVTYTYLGETVLKETATYDSTYTIATGIGRDGYEAVKWATADGTEYSPNSTFVCKFVNNITLNAELVAYISAEFTITVNGDEATITGYGGSDSSVIVPDYVKKDGSYYLVTAIGSNAFANKSSITDISIPSSVTSIDSSAFEGCSNLKFNEYDNALYLGNKDNPYVVLFKAKSTNITSCNINANVKVIYGSAFYNCSSLTGVYITDINAWYNIEFEDWYSNPLYYAHNLYLNGIKVTDLEIPDTVTEIKAYAFYGWNGTSIIIPSSVTSIGNYAFDNCTRLTKINYNATNCADLSSSNYVFSNVGKDGNGITVNIGANVQRIPAYLFCPYSSSSYFPKIISVVFAENSQCTSIGSLAFFSCSSLKTVYYGGTASEWSKISISNSNSPLTSATRYYFSETNPFEGDNAVSSGNYWHYDTDNKTPVIWKKEN